MNSFKVIKAYLVKKAQETIPDSPERRRALEDLQYSPQLAPHYLSKGRITKEEALPFMWNAVKKYPSYLVEYFKRGLLKKEEALPFALEVLKTSPFNIQDYLEVELITKEEARPFALEIVKDNPNFAWLYFRHELITKEEAHPIVLEALKEDPSYVGSYLKEGLITKEEAHPFVLERLKRDPSYVRVYLSKGRITKEEALPFMLELFKQYPSHFWDYLREGVITKEEARPLVLELLKKDPYKVKSFFTEEIITREDALPFVQEILKKMPSDAIYYFKEGLITKEEALPFALKLLKDYPGYVGDCFKGGLMTREEALPLALESLKENLDYLVSFFTKGLLTREEALSFVLERLKEAPDRSVYYFDQGLITKEEALPFALEHLKKDPSKVNYYFEYGILTKQDVNDFLSGHLSTSVNDFSHAHTLNVEILQKLRSLAKKGGGSVASSEAPQLKKFFSGKPSLSVADIDKMIAREQQQNKHNAYSFEHSIWAYNKMQNSFKQDQLVIKVSALPNALQSEINSKIYLKKFMTYVKESTANHPSPYGWARVHVKSPGVWIIDEIQSDVVSVARLAFREDIPEDLEDHEAEIKAFAAKHFADSMRKLILSAVTERAHKAGINKIEHMNVEFKADQNLSSYRSFGEAKRYTQDQVQHHQPIKVVDSNGKLVDTTKGNIKDSDIPLPAHYVDTYHEGPQKAGFERDESTGRWVKFSRRK